MTKPTNPYLLIPQRLCMDVRDSPVAIGVYALVARLFLVSHQAIPLSASDIRRFDAKVSYGQARRALDRLADTGWLKVSSIGRKNGYLPTWGKINGTSRPWCFGAERFGRPPHVRCYRIEADQIDGIGYFTPHTSSTALVVAGSSPTTLAEIAIRVLVYAGLREPNLIDHLIDPSIDQTHTTETTASAPESQEKIIETNPGIPWESWDSNQLMNQPSCMSTAVQQIVGGGIVSVSSVAQPTATQPQASASDVLHSKSPITAELDSTIFKGHQELNCGRILFPGEWFELAALQQTYSVKQLLIWQSRAQCRHNPIERITPAYYRACAEQDAAEQTRAAKALKRAAKPRTSHEATQSKPAPAAPPAMLTEQVAAQLNMLGIKIHTGLEACDSALLTAWVAASQHADWALIWDDPGAAARALLLQGKQPPSPALIARRVAAKKQALPTDWGAIVVQSGGLARLGSDLSDIAESPIAAVIADSRYSYRGASGETDTLEEHLRMVLRLHAPTRPQYQAVERLWLRQVADGIQVCAGRIEDEPILRGLLPVMTRVLGQRRLDVGNTLQSERGPNMETSTG